MIGVALCRRTRAWVLLLGATLACGSERTAEDEGRDAALDGATAAGEAQQPAVADDVSGAYEALTAQGTMAFVAGDTAQALSDFQEARRLRPGDPEAAVNVAIAALFAGEYDLALDAADSASRDPDTRASARYVTGCVHLRRDAWDAAEAALADAASAAPGVSATHFQLGWARHLLEKYDGAADAFGEVVRLDPLHPSAHYMLSQVFARLGRADDARTSAARHREALLASTRRADAPSTRESFEACVLTDPRMPPQEQPDAESISVRFVAASGDVFDDPGAYDGPLAYLDVDQDDDLDLFVVHGARGRVLRNEAGRLVARGEGVALGDGRFVRALAGRLKSGKENQVVLLGGETSRLFTFPLDGDAVDISPTSGLMGVGGRDALLVNLDHSGALDLVVATGTGLLFMRNSGHARFADETDQMALPRALEGAASVATGDYDGDDLLDLLAACGTGPSIFFSNQREGRVAETELPAPIPQGSLVVTEDFDGDFALDALVASGSEIVCRLGSGSLVTVASNASNVSALQLIDYDNDGWLDVLALGDRLSLYRNLGERGFLDVTADVGLDAAPEVTAALPMDVDTDGDTDLVLAKAGGGLELLRNEGGNANASVRLTIYRTSDGDSVYGTRVEIFAGGFRTSRTVNRIPLDIGLGRHALVGLVNVVWPDQIQQLEEIVTRRPDGSLAVVRIAERYSQAGSCPYLYAWDGERFRFVTDILGVSPLGLPLAPGRLTPADTDELAWVGNASTVVPRDGVYELRVTEELREVLFLDETTLVVVDHPAGTEVHPTDKLRMPPFPPSEIVMLEDRVPLRSAASIDGIDVSDALRETDGALASPPEILGDHLRGRAAPHGYVLDFGAFDARVPWVLALTGWLRYGGASGNMAAARDPELPNPFPTLEVETARGAWRPLDVMVGLPAGKTKTILVDLDGVLPKDARRLRLSLASEVHWDRIALFRRAPGEPRITELAPDATELRYHGYGQIEPHAWNEPITNSYHRLSLSPPWRWTPEGYYTRYGEVGELLNATDDRMVILGGGDEVALSFAASRLPALPPGFERDVFFYSVGWDKDADYNCIHGLTVGPLPFHGMDDQRYGEESRPAGLPDEWIARYNTRFVGAEVPGTRIDTPVDAYRARAAAAVAWRSPLAAERPGLR